MSENKYKYYRSTFYFEGKQYSATGKTQREADKKAAIKLDKMERGEVGISSKMLAKKWAYEYLTIYVKPRNGQDAYKNNLRLLNNFIKPYLGNLGLEEIKDIHLQKAINSMQGYSYYYIEKTANLIKAIFRQARISRLIIFDPAENILIPNGNPSKSRRSITDFEREHILKVADVHEYGLIVKTLLYTGIRPGELRALQWKHIDLEKGYLYIRQAVESGTENIKEPKSQAGIRDIPIPEILLNEFKIAQKKNSPFDFVFLQSKGKVMHTKSSFSKVRKSFFKAVDISMGASYEKVKAADGKMRLACVLSVISPELDFYHLRHTYGTDLQRAGVPINIAKTLMGHSKIELTSQVYTHTTTDVLEDAREKINVKNNAKNLSTDNKLA